MDYQDVDDTRDFVNTSNCHAIVPSSGTQCDASVPDHGLCGTHESARNVSRVDDIPGAPFADIRDLLVDAGLHGTHAYRFATRFRNPGDLWRAITGLDPITIGDKTFDADGLATHADTIAKLSSVEAGNHPLAHDQCIAITGAGDRCTSGGYGTGLLCGTHKKANDPDTVLDDADFPKIRTADGDDFYIVELRGDAAIVVDLDGWKVRRIDRDRVDAVHTHLDVDDGDDWIGYVDDDQGPESFDGPTWRLECSDCDHCFEADSENADCRECGDVVSPHTIVGIAGDAPDHLVDVDVGDRVSVELANTDRVLDGTISEIASGGWDTPENGAKINIYIDDVDEVRDLLRLTCERVDAADDWSETFAYDVDVLDDDGDDTAVPMGPISGVRLVEESANSEVKQADNGDMNQAKAGGNENENGRRVRCRDCGHEWHTSADSPRCADPNDECDRSRDVDDVDYLDRIETLESAGLSGREAEVVANKNQGLTHPKIAEKIDLPKSTVDEYSRRARRKVLEARELVAAAGETYE